MKCLVSGATGFIGRQLCHQLEIRGDTVIPLSKHGAPPNGGRSVSALDLTVSGPDDDQLRGVDVVFHLAGVAHQHAPDSAYYALNYEATMRLARLAARSGVGCFVFLSSVKAMGAPASGAVRAENMCAQPLDAYGRSKLQAELSLCEEFSDSRMSVVIVRPALVYGAGVKGNLQQLVRGVRLGLPRPPEGGVRSMIAVEDLVELLCVIAQSPPSGLQTWIACGENSYSTQAIYDLLREALGKSRGHGWVPKWGWRMGARLLDMVLRQNGESSYDKLFGTELYSNAAVLAQTHWRPRVRLEDVIDQIAEVGSRDA